MPTTSRTDFRQLDDETAHENDHLRSRRAAFEQQRSRHLPIRIQIMTEWLTGCRLIS